MKASGIRMGTPAVTTRGMREPEMEKIAGWIAEVLDHLGDARDRTARPRRSGRIRREVPSLYAAASKPPRRLSPALARPVEQRT